MGDKVVENGGVGLVSRGLDVSRQIRHFGPEAWGTLRDPAFAWSVGVVVDSPEGLGTFVLAKQMDPPVVQVSLQIIHVQSIPCTQDCRAKILTLPAKTCEI